MAGDLKYVWAGLETKSLRWPESNKCLFLFSPYL